MNKLPLILCIETSAGICSVAIGRGAEILCQVVEYQRNSAADKLQTLIDELLTGSGLQFRDIDAVAVSGGPGSYTGLRIGVSTAKGIAYALGIPLIHIESFQAMKAQLQLQESEKFDLYIPMIDARRADAFLCVMDSKREYLMPPQCITIEENTFDIWRKKGQIMIFGQELDKFRAILSGKDLEFRESIYLYAGSMAGLAYEKFEQKMLENIAYYEPRYYKSFHSSIK